MTPFCRKCKASMMDGYALQQTLVGGEPDFSGDKHSTTFSADGPERLIKCWKCPNCGWSMTK